MITRRTFLALLVLLSTPLSCLAEANNLQPHYGDGKFTQAQLTLNDKFIKTAIADSGTKARAVESVLALANKARNSGDFEVAMKRYNQVWLLDPQNPNADWGIAIVLGEQKQFSESLKYFELASSKLKKDVAFLNDYALGTFRAGAMLAKSETEFFGYAAKALMLVQSAQKAEPTYEGSYSNEAIFHFARHDGAKAWAAVKKARALGGKTLDPRLVADLKKQMPEPK